MNVQLFTDRAAIGLSFLCALHCLALPVVMVGLPSVAALSLDDEAFHQWMLAVVIPISLFALLAGCRQHKRYPVLGLGLGGLAMLICAALAGHDALGETGEKVLTLMGAVVISAGHFLNQRLCRHQQCDCDT